MRLNLFNLCVNFSGAIESRIDPSINPQYWCQMSDVRNGNLIRVMDNALTKRMIPVRSSCSSTGSDLLSDSHCRDISLVSLSAANESESYLMKLA